MRTSAGKNTTTKKQNKNKQWVKRPHCGDGSQSNDINKQQPGQVAAASVRCLSANENDDSLRSA